ncbi:light-regulated zinc finger protein 1 [Striga asiatica]|uniref:Light-regulated zinc finger protein 1 n=1 Tax=Striga asiatica TaxID=4170 RepID=A0A5A7R4N5_STRAF|nr:light-regulated zinc finger protein 1 [Striga asiatica]
MAATEWSSATGHFICKHDRRRRCRKRQIVIEIVVVYVVEAADMTVASKEAAVIEQWSQAAAEGRRMAAGCGSWAEGGGRQRRTAADQLPTDGGAGAGIASVTKKTQMTGSSAATQPISTTPKPATTVEASFQPLAGAGAGANRTTEKSQVARTPARAGYEADFSKGILGPRPNLPASP